MVEERRRQNLKKALNSNLHTIHPPYNTTAILFTIIAPTMKPKTNSHGEWLTGSSSFSRRPALDTLTLALQKFNRFPFKSVESTIFSASVIKTHLKANDGADGEEEKTIVTKNR